MTEDVAAARRLRRRRALLVVFAVAASVLAAELALQLAGLLARHVYVRGGEAGLAGADVTILCVGDSHTYGLPLPDAESYPAQLEVALQARSPAARIRVVNLGIPGLNSAFVVNRLERQIHQIRPVLVIAWVGINNLWNPVEQRDRREDDRLFALRRALMHVKLFRLASIAWYNATGHQYDPELRGGWYTGEVAPSGHLPPGTPMPDPAPGLARDLGQLSEITRNEGIPLLFVAYPMKSQRAINRVIVATGARLGVGVIDTSRDLARAFADHHTSDELIDTRAGPHPSGLLYAYIVESMLPEVMDALGAWHAIGFDGAGAREAGAGPPDGRERPGPHRDLR